MMDGLWSAHPRWFVRAPLTIGVWRWGPAPDPCCACCPFSMTSAWWRCQTWYALHEFHASSQCSVLGHFVNAFLKEAGTTLPHEQVLRIMRCIITGLFRWNQPSGRVQLRSSTIWFQNIITSIFSSWRRFFLLARCGRNRSGLIARASRTAHSPPVTPKISREQQSAGWFGPLVCTPRLVLPH